MLADLKICFLALTLGQGGAERQLYYMLKVLQEQNAHVRLLSLTRGEFWEKPIEELGVPVTWVGRYRSRISRLLQIIFELQEDRPDILQSQHLFVNMYVAGAARILGSTEIGAIRNDGVTGVDSIGKLAGYLTLQLPRCIAANSRAAIANVTANGVPPERLFFLPNVVDTDLFGPLAPRTDPCVYLTAVGRLVEQKRFDRFLRVLQHVIRRTDTKVKGVIVGPGSLRIKLERQVTTLGLCPEQIEFKGKANDVASIYRQSDIFVSTSDWEGTPNVILEAMASGLPVVATRVGDVPDLVTHGYTGYLVEPEDEKTMVEALLQLIENLDQRKQFGQRARERVVGNFSLHRLPGMLNNLYQQVMSNKQQGYPHV
ncbi:MAG: glycosyltransferase [Chloroflexi bacterium]|jgi:glycosyltransferase involved in cell wall biosynthesis|nr:glycosyltransferase [Chloroflexota bacterium]